MIRKILLSLLIFSATVLVGSLYFFNTTNLNSSNTHPLTNHSSDEFHVHADFLVVLNGTVLNFSKDEFMSGLHTNKHGYVHLHDSIGNVIHYHKENITLETFFTSLNMQFNQTCFVTNDNTSFCEDSSNSLYMYVNGALVEEKQDYIANDLDQILVLYGNYTQEEIEEYQLQVSDEACIHSNICRERIPEDFVSDAQGSCVTGFSCGGVELDFLNN